MTSLFPSTALLLLFLSSSGLYDGVPAREGTLFKPDPPSGQHPSLHPGREHDGPDHRGPAGEHPGRPPMADSRPGGGPPMHGPLFGVRPPPWAPMMRVLGERRPDLARRLERLRREDPERFHDVMMGAFIVQVEESLERAERQRPEGPGDERPEAGDRERPHPPGPHPPGPGPHHAAHERHVRELHERHENLERESNELAEEIRRLRERHAPREEVMPVQERLEQVVNEHFEVRTELRETELERLEREVRHLEERIERMRHDFELRERQRDSIIDRRMRQLLGEHFGGW